MTRKTGYNLGKKQKMKRIFFHLQISDLEIMEGTQYCIGLSVCNPFMASEQLEFSSKSK